MADPGALVAVVKVEAKAAGNAPAVIARNAPVVMAKTRIPAQRKARRFHPNPQGTQLRPVHRPTMQRPMRVHRKRVRCRLKHQPIHNRRRNRRRLLRHLKRRRKTPNEAVPRTGSSYRSVAATRSPTNLRSLPVAENLTHL